MQLQAVEGYLRQFNAILDYKKKGSVRSISEAQIETLMKVEGINAMFNNETAKSFPFRIGELNYLNFFLTNLNFFPAPPPPQPPTQ